MDALAYKWLILIFGWIGELTSLLFYINPFFTIKQLNDNPEYMETLSSGIDLLSIFLSCLLWFLSDLLGKHFYIITDAFTQTNYLGANLTFIVVTMYIFFYVKVKKEVEDPEKPDEKKIIFQVDKVKFLIFFISLIDITFELCYFTVQLVDHESKDVFNFVFKGIAALFNCLIYTSSWYKIITLYRTGESENISLPGYYLGVINHGAWVIYAAIEMIHFHSEDYENQRDFREFIFVLVANFICCSMCVTQIIIYNKYATTQGIDAQGKIEPAGEEDENKEDSEDKEKEDEKKDNGSKDESSKEELEQEGFD